MFIEEPALEVTEKMLAHEKPESSIDVSDAEHRVLTILPRELNQKSVEQPDIDSRKPGRPASFQYQRPMVSQSEVVKVLRLRFASPRSRGTKPTDFSMHN
jgi:hypothetical protein